MRLFRRKCTFLLDLLGLISLIVLGSLVVHQFWSKGGGRGGGRSFLTSADLRRGSRDLPRSVVAVSLGDAARAAPADDDAHCSMGSCFDVSRCSEGFRVYVYPDVPGHKVSPLYGSILSLVRNSHYSTTDPTKACLFLPSLDTLDRDVLSPDYIKGLPDLASLPYWNGGLNHVIFNQFAGSWPEYGSALNFNTGKAILAKASFSVDDYRPGFDISIPLVHKDHPVQGGEEGSMSRKGNVLPVKRRYLLVFKGKRYLYGVGKESRSSLYHLHNGKDMILLTTCKHNKDWSKYQDSRCHQDNLAYDSYKYYDLLENSTFCLVPRGRRLGSFRFLEALQASCIPVSLSNGYILPFQEVIDWNKAALVVDERQLLQVAHTVRSVPTHQLLSMRMQSQFLWETYFNSLEKTVFTTFEIIRNRLNPRGSYVWNTRPGGLHHIPSFSPSLLHYPFYSQQRVSHTPGTNYTAVISSTRPALKGTSPLVRLVKSIADAPHLDKIIILWFGSGQPRVSLPSFSTPVIVREMPSYASPTSQFGPLPEVETSAILNLGEDTELTVDEAEFGFATWCSFPERLVGFVAHRHYWDPVHLQWSYSSRWTNEYSIVLSEAMFYHRYYGYLLTHSLSPTVRSIADNNRHCLSLAVNFVVSQVTRQSPVKVTHRKELSRGVTETPSSLQRLTSERVSCLNMLVNAYGFVPLVSSSIRMDPVLFKDNVSMLRKEYRKLEYRKLESL